MPSITTVDRRIAQLTKELLDCYLCKICGEQIQLFIERDSVMNRLIIEFYCHKESIFLSINEIYPFEEYDARRLIRDIPFQDNTGYWLEPRFIRTGCIETCVINPNGQTVFSTTEPEKTRILKELHMANAPRPVPPNTKTKTEPQIIDISERIIEL